MFFLFVQKRLAEFGTIPFSNLHGWFETNIITAQERYGLHRRHPSYGLFRFSDNRNIQAIFTFKHHRNSTQKISSIVKSPY